MKQVIIISIILIGIIGFVVFQPKLTHAPTVSPIASATFPPEPKPAITEQKQKLETYFGKANSCAKTDSERLAEIIVTEQAGHDGSGVAYYEFRIHVTDDKDGKQYVVDGTIDIGGNIHVDRKVEEFQTCPI